MCSSWRYPANSAKHPCTCNCRNAPSLILFNAQICCCGTAEPCTATLRPCRKPSFSRCQRMSGGSKLQRSLEILFVCAVTCAWYVHSRCLTVEMYQRAQVPRSHATPEELRTKVIMFSNRRVHSPPLPSKTSSSSYTQPRFFSPASPPPTGPRTPAPSPTCTPLLMLQNCLPFSAILLDAPNAITVAAF